MPETTVPLSRFQVPVPACEPTRMSLVAESVPLVLTLRRPVPPPPLSSPPTYKRAPLPVGPPTRRLPVPCPKPVEMPPPAAVLARFHVPLPPSTPTNIQLPDPVRAIPAR